MTPIDELCHRMENWRPNDNAQETTETALIHKELCQKGLSPLEKGLKLLELAETMHLSKSVCKQLRKKNLDIIYKSLHDLTGEELLYLLSTHYILTQLGSKTKTSHKMIRALFKVGVWFCQKKTNREYFISVYGEPFWYQDTYATYQTKQPLHETITRLRIAQTKITKTNARQSGSIPLSTSSELPYFLEQDKTTSFHDFYAILYNLQKLMKRDKHLEFQKENLFIMTYSWLTDKSSSDCDKKMQALVTASLLFLTLKSPSPSEWEQVKLSDMTFQLWQKTYAFTSFIHELMQNKESINDLIRLLSILKEHDTSDNFYQTTVRKAIVSCTSAHEQAELFSKFATIGISARKASLLLDQKDTSRLRNHIRSHPSLFIPEIWTNKALSNELRKDIISEYCLDPKTTVISTDMLYSIATTAKNLGSSYSSTLLPLLRLKWIVSSENLLKRDTEAIISLFEDAPTELKEEIYQKLIDAITAKIIDSSKYLQQNEYYFDFIFEELKRINTLCYPVTRFLLEKIKALDERVEFVISRLDHKLFCASLFPPRFSLCIANSPRRVEKAATFESYTHDAVSLICHLDYIGSNPKRKDDIYLYCIKIFINEIYALKVAAVDDQKKGPYIENKNALIRLIKTLYDSLQYIPTKHTCFKELQNLSRKELYEITGVDEEFNVTCDEKTLIFKNKIDAIQIHSAT